MVLAMIRRMIPEVPANIRCRRAAVYSREIGYSSM